MPFSSTPITRLARLSSVLVMLFSTAATASAQFIGLGDLPGGIFQSEAFYASADGSVVIGYGRSESGSEAFRWTRATGMVSLGGLNSSAQGISADGAVVVGFNNSAAGREAFRWTQAGGMVGLGDLPGGGFASLARAASADGAVIVGEGTSAAGREAFRWTQAGGIVGLGDLPGGSFSSVATAVSANGAVVIGYSNSVNGPEPFRWTQAGGMVGLGDFPGGIFQSYGNAVSADGSVVVGTGWPAGTDYGRAFRWTQATGMVELGTLPNLIESGAHGVSADGSVIVGYYVRPTHAAFIWTRDGGMRDLQDMLVNDYRYDLTGWTLNYAWDVSADGQWVIGSGRSPNGTLEAWVANIAPIPEPSSMALAGLGLAALAGYGWRKRRETGGHRWEPPPWAGTDQNNTTNPAARK